MQDRSRRLTNLDVLVKSNTATMGVMEPAVHHEPFEADMVKFYSKAYFPDPRPNSPIPLDDLSQKHSNNMCANDRSGDSGSSGEGETQQMPARWYVVWTQ